MYLSVDQGDRTAQVEMMDPQWKVENDVRAKSAR